MNILAIGWLVQIGNSKNKHEIQMRSCATGSPGKYILARNRQYHISNKFSVKLGGTKINVQIKNIHLKYIPAILTG